MKTVRCKSLLLGCGHSHDKRLWVGDQSFDELVLHDFSPDIESDYDHDLNRLPYPWADWEFDEIHAYEVLEHCGTQGDGEFFFEQFNEFWRILKPGGHLMLSVPIWNREVALGVPDHKRVLPGSVFGFLEESYYENVGKPGYADYRYLIKGYWQVIGSKEHSDSLYLILKKS